MITQSLLLCSDRVGMSSFVAKSLPFLGEEGLVFDDKRGVADVDWGRDGDPSGEVALC